MMMRVNTSENHKGVSIELRLGSGKKIWKFDKKENNFLICVSQNYCKSLCFSVPR